MIVFFIIQAEEIELNYMQNAIFLSMPYILCNVMNWRIINFVNEWCISLILILDLWL